jgi:hypothetical protein
LAVIVFGDGMGRMLNSGPNVKVKVYELTTRLEDSAATAQRLYTLSGPGRAFEDITFSPDGARLVASARVLGRLHLVFWDLQTAQEVLALAQRQTNDGQTSSTLFFSADGRYLVLRDYDGTTVWEGGKSDRLTRPVLLTVPLLLLTVLACVLIVTRRLLRGRKKTELDQRYVARGTEKQGPLSLAQLQAAGQGTVQPTDMVLQTGTQRRAAGEVTGLFPAPAAEPVLADPVPDMEARSDALAPDPLPAPDNEVTAASLACQTTGPILPGHAAPTPDDSSGTVGRLERVRRWRKRNPALAAVGLSLIVGSIVALAFAILVAAKKPEPEEANDRQLSSMARILVRPLGKQDPLGPPLQQLSVPEIEALWELGGRRRRSCGCSS